MEASRQRRVSVKEKGYVSSKEALRARCVARLKDEREAILSRFRSIPEEEEDSCIEVIRSVAREIVVDRDSEVLPEDYDDLVRFVEDSLREDLEFLVREHEKVCAEQNDQDCELFEQHCLSGIPCPLCNLGRLAQENGILLCTRCDELRVPVMDEGLTLDVAAEMLGESELQHRRAGCKSRPRYTLQNQTLFLACDACGWLEVAI